MFAKKKAPKLTKVLLTQSVKGLGATGDIVSVKQAYFDNFMFAQNLGKLATKEILDQKAAEEAAAKAEAVALRAAAEESVKTMQAIFGSQGLFIKKKVGKEGAIFGSVTSTELATLVKERTGVDVDKRKIEVPSIRPAFHDSMQFKL